MHFSYQIYYSQASARPGYGSTLKMVNWWSAMDGLVRFPLLPPPKKVYKNFEGRYFNVPVLHVRVINKLKLYKSHEHFEYFYT